MNRSCAPLAGAAATALVRDEQQNLPTCRAQRRETRPAGRVAGASRGRAAGLALLLAVGSPAPGELLVRHALPQSLQATFADLVLTICRDRGSAVSVAIADAAGTVRTLVSSDGVSALAIETARRKAKTAAIVGHPTSGLVKAAREAPAYVSMLSSLHPDMIFIGGGMPIRRGEELVGAIGVGGARNGDEDEACARDALQALSGRIEAPAQGRGR